MAGRLIAALALLLAAAMVTVSVPGCGGNKKSGSSSQPSTTGAQPSNQQGSAAPKAPIVLSGSGTQATQQFSLARGLAVSSMHP